MTNNHVTLEEDGDTYEFEEDNLQISEGTSKLDAIKAMLRGYWTFLVVICVDGSTCTRHPETFACIVLKRWLGGATKAAPRLPYNQFNFNALCDASK